MRRPDLMQDLKRRYGRFEDWPINYQIAFHNGYWARWGRPPCPYVEGGWYK
jgi:hypothetical protein